MSRQNTTFSAGVIGLGDSIKCKKLSKLLKKASERNHMTDEQKSRGVGRDHSVPSQGSRCDWTMQLIQGNFSTGGGAPEERWKMQKAHNDLPARMVLSELLRSCAGRHFSCSKVCLRCKRDYSHPAPWPGMAAGSTWELLHALVIT